MADVPATALGGVFLAASLTLMLTETKGFPDPAWAAVLICGLPVLYAALSCLLEERRITSELLVSIAMLAAIAIGELFAAGEVAFIMAIGAILEEKTIRRAKKGLKNLIGLAPRQGRLILSGGAEEMVKAEDIKKGDLLRILPGEVIPVDGEIIRGSTSVDQSVITGESLPEDKEAGDAVFCGTINRFGAVDIRATGVGQDSSLQKLIRMVSEAEKNKAPMQRTVDRWAAGLVPVALILAVLTWLATRDAVRAVTILVVFCPCALALATPTAIMAAIGQAARHGVIIKSGEALERMGRVDCIAFDKTGTLTYGNLTVSDVISFDAELAAEEILGLAASVESLSEHPLAKALCADAKKRGLETAPVRDFRMIPGKGVRADAGGGEVLCGSIAWLGEQGTGFGKEMSAAAERLRSQGKAVVAVARDGRPLGVLALSDTLREDAPAMLKELKKMRTKVVLLTGDHAQTADYFARRLGIADVYAELLPSGKVEKIEEIQRSGGSICMIGDGVNDAPALKTADVGAAMGVIGSDIAVDAADIALMSDDIGRIPYLKKLSNATLRTIKFSISLSMAINFIAIILSMAGALNPISSALVHNAGSVFVVMIAALLYDRQFV